MNQFDLPDLRYLQLTFLWIQNSSRVTDAHLQYYMFYIQMIKIFMIKGVVGKTRCFIVFSREHQIFKMFVSSSHNKGAIMEGRLKKGDIKKRNTMSFPPTPFISLECPMELHTL
jgi:hypothetical protein